MSPFCWLMLLLLSSKGKKNLDCRCPLCGERYRITLNGHYWRYRFNGSNALIAVQRYCCSNPDCPRKTFSIPPCGLMPYYRLPLCILLQIYHHHMADHVNISQLAKGLNVGWNTVKRALNLMSRIQDLVRGETDAGSLPKVPTGHGLWSRFIRALSYAFFPERFCP